jgi:hypothetical protein
LVVNLSAEPLRPGELPAALARLIGQHPSAIRSICFSEESHEPGALGHLEIETKHGFVTLIDHRTGETYTAPPAPPAVRIQDRQQRDLTDELPGAFADRPRFSKVAAMNEDGVLRGWRFELDTGVAFTLTLDERLPIVAAML